ncbi:hypothetical protein TCAL_08773 [Tigriopus californicus]|uniref:Sugar phosphate transporter domain-containing protein n=1 Tax=Tigriopus californicus TaxID=6832 RepID=A0A553PMH3_TIGCA|nr:hypothetical protein TCAL_08773 [Tigriopus californicus]|eukprot:TCALIF_08773-PB protein Name:"Similar to At4g35335 CMP-sialic acid transporter 4 (Arabidopsis thaliana)" AED:0.10 eAED:0.10 QI:225/0.75/0.6/1/0.5/0.6/5/244/317
MIFKAILANKDLFPTRLSLVVFVGYVGLFTAQGLLVTASRNGNTTYPYNTTTVVLLTEVLKLALSTLIFLKDHTFWSFISEVYDNKSMLIMFKRYLSGMQWYSLCLVTLGCVVQKLDYATISKLFGPVDLSIQNVFYNSISFLLIVVQLSCSVCAGVYNEYLIKGNSGKNVHLMVQNVYMCLDSIFWNTVVLSYQGQLITAFSMPSLASIAQTLVILIIVNNACAGIITSMFLMNLNSIAKAFASAIEIVFTAMLSYLLFDIPIYINTVISVMISSYAIVVYAKNPVKNPPVKSYLPNADKRDTSLKEKLLENTPSV